ncbi:hypothetical protein QFZ68_007614 [Streptomyces sp. V1I6]|nr:hypothetical protein [Streptomyces sp. V1I6]
MAVTQQLARVSGAYLARCRASAAAVPGADPDWDPPTDDRIDLDWSPRFIVGACELAAVGPRQLIAVKRALEGERDVDVSVLHHAEATGSFGPPPTALAPRAVAHVAAELNALDWDRVLAAVPAERRHSLAGAGFSGDPVSWLTDRFTALRTFYTGAAQRGLFVVLWWD